MIAAVMIVVAPIAAQPHRGRPVVVLLVVVGCWSGVVVLVDEVVVVGFRMGVSGKVGPWTVFPVGVRVSR